MKMTELECLQMENERMRKALDRIELLAAVFDTRLYEETLLKITKTVREARR